MHSTGPYSLRWRGTWLYTRWLWTDAGTRSAKPRLAVPQGLVSLYTWGTYLTSGAPVKTGLKTFFFLCSYSKKFLKFNPDRTHVTYTYYSVRARALKSWYQLQWVPLPQKGYPSGAYGIMNGMGRDTSMLCHTRCDERKNRYPPSKPSYGFPCLWKGKQVVLSGRVDGIGPEAANGWCFRCISKGKQVIHGYSWWYGPWYVDVMKYS